MKLLMNMTVAWAMRIAPSASAVLFPLRPRLRKAMCKSVVKAIGILPCRPPPRHAAVPGLLLFETRQAEGVFRDRHAEPDVDPVHLSLLVLVSGCECQP